MSLLALLVVLLLFLVVLLVVSALGYAAYRHPVLTQPLTVSLAAATTLGSVVATVATIAVR
ncbi:hypothetical protein [Streptomyces sp. PU-14G]|uniref:hypothetical protein n=1 Tax=Streptomyces sp. PU-14G TaxID=2800808 RepID=UPI0034E016DC